jgi:hypothetical protein
MSVSPDQVPEPSESTTGLTVVVGEVVMTSPSAVQSLASEHQSPVMAVNASPAGAGSAVPVAGAPLLMLTATAFTAPLDTVKEPTAVQTPELGHEIPVICSLPKERTDGGDGKLLLTATAEDGSVIVWGVPPPSCTDQFWM